MTQLRQQLYAWRSVIFALYLRELQSKFNDKFGTSWAFIEPFLFIMLLSFIRGRISGGDVHTVPIFIFMMIGLVGLRFLTETLTAVSRSVKKNKPLYAFRQVQPMSAILTSGFLELSIKVAVIGLLALSVYLMDQTFDMFDPLLLITLFVILWIFAISLGILFAVAEAFVPEVNKLKAFMMRPLMFISCVFFSLQDIPQEYWYLFTWNPLVHFLELGRYACFESYGHDGVSMNYILTISTGFLFFALAVYHISWKKVLAR
ncbi:ABC transporter permease [Alteromonas sp. CYL-A6]|uniref:ABC transporter permease n=1 Tax=Alteromonas nitratireducens TaxID=3390813 RepID=UPI0034A72080